MNKTIRIGTRKSALALAQTELVARGLREAYPDVNVELVTKVTEGDRILDRPLLEFGGKGVFVTELEQALLSGEIDLAVHSAKDLPMDLAKGLAIVSVSRRADPRDVLVTLAGTDLDGKRELVMGTSSLRRRLQLEEAALKMWPKATVRCKDIRGNVHTRLNKMEAGEYDGLILAAAGLSRLELLGEDRYLFQYFDCETFIPAGGQGILAVEGRCGDEISRMAAGIGDWETGNCLALERKMLKRLEAGCHEPIGVYSRQTAGRLEVFGISGRNGKTRRIHMDGEIEKLDLLAERGVKGLE